MNRLNEEDTMKKYCLGCGKFCIMLEAEAGDDCVELNVNRAYDCRMTGQCYCNSDDRTEDLSLEYFEESELLGKDEKVGFVKVSGELLQDLNAGLYLKRVGDEKKPYLFTYVAPMRKSYMFSDDDPVWDSEEAHKSLKSLSEAKKALFEKCGEFLQKTPCPLEPDDKRCIFFVERAVNDWNSGDEKEKQEKAMH